MREHSHNFGDSDNRATDMVNVPFFPILLEIRLVDDPKSCRFSSVSKVTKEAQFRSNWSIILCRFLRVRYPDAKIYTRSLHRDDVVV
jgi:hypothetical protein